MLITHSKSLMVVLFSLGGLLWQPAAALAGPNLICHAYDIGNAPSLPWGSTKEWQSKKPDYPRERLVDDTLALLVPATPVLVRMETLRRATLYAEGRPDLARELLGRLMLRVLEAEAKGAPAVLPWFDAGYLVASLHEAARLPNYPRLASGLDGYGWVSKAIRSAGPNPEMEFAAALIRHERPARPGQHWPRASSGAKDGSLLARNLGLFASDGR